MSLISPLSCQHWFHSGTNTLCKVSNVLSYFHILLYCNNTKSKSYRKYQHLLRCGRLHILCVPHIHTKCTPVMSYKWSKWADCSNHNEFKPISYKYIQIVATRVWAILTDWWSRIYRPVSTVLARVWARHDVDSEVDTYGRHKIWPLAQQRRTK